MSDFLTSLVSRTLGTAPVVRPRLPSLFEPAAPYIEPPSAIHGERERSNRIEDVSPVVRVQANEREAPVGKRRRETPLEPELPRPSAPPETVQQPEAHPVNLRHRNAAAPAAGRPSFDEQPATSAITPGDSQPSRVFTTAKPRTRTLAGDIAPQTSATSSLAQTPSRVVPRIPLAPSTPTLVPPVPPVPAVQVKTETTPQVGQTRGLEANSALVEPASPPARHEPVRPTTALEPKQLPHFAFARHIPVAPPAAPSEPIIQITIGRIEVRAVLEKTATAKERQASPVMSLNDYLRSRQGAV